MVRNRIVVISQVPPPTHGSTVMTRTLLEVLEEGGWQTQLVDRRFSRSVGEVGSISPRKIAAVPALVLRLVLAVLNRPAACVFFCTNRPFSFLVDVVLGEVLRLFRIRTINYVHTNGYADLAAKGRIWHALVRRLLAHGDRTVCLATSLVEDVRPFVRQGSTFVIPNAIAEPSGGRSSVDVRLCPRGPVLFLSNLLEEKGADVFVDMAIELCGRLPDTTFALVGQEADPALADALRRRVEQSGHADRVRFVGPKFDAEKWDVLAGAQVLVFPSRYRYEAQPLAIIEAFSVGVPVVASDVGAIRELVNGQNGHLLTEPSSAEASKAVMEILESPERRERAAAGARKSFTVNHSLTAFREAWEIVLDADRDVSWRETA